MVATSNIDLFHDAATYAICSFKREFTKFLPYKDLLNCSLVCKTWDYNVKMLTDTWNRILDWKFQKCQKSSERINLMSISSIQELDEELQRIENAQRIKQHVKKFRNLKKIVLEQEKQLKK